MVVVDPIVWNVFLLSLAPVVVDLFKPSVPWHVFDVFSPFMIFVPIDLLIILIEEPDKIRCLNLPFEFFDEIRYVIP